MTAALVHRVHPSPYMDIVMRVIREQHGRDACIVVVPDPPEQGNEPEDDA